MLYGVIGRWEREGECCAVLGDGDLRAREEDSCLLCFSYCSVRKVTASFHLGFRGSNTFNHSI